MPPSRRTPVKQAKATPGSARRMRTRGDTKKLNDGTPSTDNTGLGVPIPMAPCPVAANPAPPTLQAVANSSLNSSSSSSSSSFSNRSYNSLFDGSLSSISSDSSVDLDDEPKTPTPNHGFPITPGLRRLQRTGGQFLKINQLGELVVDAEPRPDPGRRSYIRYTAKEIIERASKNLDDDIRYRQTLIDTRDLENGPPVNGQAEEVHPVASGSNVTLDQPRTRALGPEGTEIFDEDELTREAPPQAIYPQKWVSCQSTSLRQHPTEEWL